MTLISVVTMQSSHDSKMSPLILTSFILLHLVTTFKKQTYDFSSNKEHVQRVYN